LDGKQQVLDKFVKDFNDFSDQYPDLREDDHTKEELHQRCDILSDELWEISEERKDQNVEERKKIMESGWAEFTLEYMTSCAQ
jgi:phosphosulfolactate synthase (CoM biosynthesis protein A)